MQLPAPTTRTTSPSPSPLPLLFTVSAPHRVSMVSDITTSGVAVVPNRRTACAWRQSRHAVPLGACWQGARRRSLAFRSSREGGRGGGEPPRRRQARSRCIAGIPCTCTFGGHGRKGSIRPCCPLCIACTGPFGCHSRTGPLRPCCPLGIPCTCLFGGRAHTDGPSSSSPSPSRVLQVKCNPHSARSTCAPCEVDRISCTYAPSCV